MLYNMLAAIMAIIIMKKSIRR